MDDVLRIIKRELKEAKLAEINNSHHTLCFTVEEEKERKLPALDMLIIKDSVSVSSTWYSKPTETGLLMNYHTLASRQYKRSVAAGFVYRIHCGCSSWKVWQKPSASWKRTSTLPILWTHYWSGVNENYLSRRRSSPCRKHHSHSKGNNKISRFSYSKEASFYWIQRGSYRGLL